jgi:cysteine synthase A
MHEPADENKSNDPLHGVTLEMILNRLVDELGWEEMGRRVRIRCFTDDPSISSSLKFLRKTPWAREKVERLYLRRCSSRPGKRPVSGPRQTILDRIGNTSMLALRKIVPTHGARILLKLENENPTGSMKDRMALAMIEAAEANGRLRPGGSVVEYTGGSTGVSLSLVCAVKGYPLHIVTSDAFAREKLDHMEILGAKLEIVPSDGGRMTEKLTRDMVEAATILAKKPGSFLTDQLNNSDPIAAYRRMGGEIWDQTNGKIDGFVQSVGTAGSLRGNGEALRRNNDKIRIVGVEPSESAVLSGGPTGAHKIDGVGAGFVVPLWRDDIADGIEQVSTEEAVAMAIRLAREEGLFAGTSTGANVVAALRLAEQMGPDATIVTIMCDSGLKYLSTALFRAHTS